jgi:hypothetical protein
VHPDVEGHPPALRRYGQGVEGMDSPLFVPRGAQGRLAPGSPRAVEVGQEQKAASVRDNPVRPEARRPPLICGQRSRPRCAIASPSRGQERRPGLWPPRPLARKRYHRAWGWGRIRSRCQITLAMAPTATIRSGIPGPALRRVTPGPSALPARQKGKRGGREWAAPVRLASPAAERLAPNAGPKSGLRRPSVRPSLARGPAATGGGLGAAAVPTAVRVLGVSSPQAQLPERGCAILFTNFNSNATKSLP